MYSAETRIKCVWKGIHSTDQNFREEASCKGKLTLATSNLELFFFFYSSFHMLFCHSSPQTQAKKPLAKTAALKAKKVAAATQPRTSGLRISFKPADLGKTTDKNMAAQV